MALPLSPIIRRGVPTPYLITPTTNEEAHCGKATLIAAGDLELLIAGIEEVAPEREDLIAKFKKLQNGGT